MKTIWLLVITHAHGDNTYPCATEEAAKQQLYGFVDNNWEAEMDEQTQPDDPEQSAAEYFDYVDEESYSITEMPLHQETA